MANINYNKVTHNPIISVIIPAYNVDQYIRKCVESVCNQSLENLEIIVIDDGSTDNTAEILNELANLDNRIIVKHKENKGVSAARNEGIRTSKGEYLVFVDGDDYLDEDYLKKMVDIAQKENADFCISKNCFTSNRDLPCKENIQRITNNEAKALLLSPRVVVGCWNKIYKATLIKEIFFSEELKYGEGLHFIERVAQNASRIATTDYRGYYYRRNNQYSATTTFKLENVMNGLMALDMIEQDVELKSEIESAMLLLHRCMYNMGACTRLRVSNDYNKYKELYNTWLKFVRKNLRRVVTNPLIPVYRKILLITGAISPLLLGKMDILRRKRIVKKSIQ